MFEAGRGIILTVLAFGLMVFFHELGHFLAAKLMGVRVDVFSFGLGPRLFGRKWGTTDYMVSAIPIGGYVKMAGGDEGEEATGAPDEFVSKSPGQRTFVLAAGPVFSVLLGVPMALFMLVGGRDYFVPRVSDLTVDSPAWKAGVHHGDLIRSVDGTKVETFEDLRRLVASAPSDTPLPLVVERDGAEHTLTCTLPKGEALGVYCIYQTPTVRKVSPDTPAAAAGMEPGDTITHVNGERLRGWLDFRSHVRPSAGAPLTLTLERDGNTRTVQVTPEPSDSKWPGFTVHLPTTVGTIRPGVPAGEKLQKGDRITAVNGQPVTTWDGIERAVLAGPDRVALAIEREGKAAEVTVERGAGIRATDSLGIAPRLAYVIGDVEQATEPPVQPGDVIVKVRGKDIAEEISAGGLYTPMDDILGSLATVGTLTVQRGEEMIDVTFEPVDRQVGLIGIEATQEVLHRKMGFFEAIGPAFRQTWSMFTFSFVMIGKLATGALKFGNLMGPVGIIQHTYISARQGLSELFRLIHLITVSIGVFNLIPIPPLDGGRILMVAYEKVRGKAPSRRFQEVLILAGVGVVLLIFVMATFNDMKRLFGL